MLNILMVSEDQGRSAQIEKLAGGSLNCKINVTQAGAWREPAKLDDVRASDVLIAIYDHLQADDLVDLDMLLAHASQAVGVLLTSAPLSAADISAVMRVGVRYVKAWPLDEAEFLQELRRMEQRKQTQHGVDGHVMTFLSSQGGSGTTLAATQAAHACATVLGKKVLLIDADRQYADAQLFLTPALPATTLVELAAQVERMDGALFDAGVTRLRTNLDLLAGAGDPVKAAQIQADQMLRIVQFASSRYDVVVVDAGHHIDAVVMTLLDQSNAICAVMRQSVPDLYSAKRLASILRGLGYADDKLHTIVNQFDGAAKLDLEVLRNTLQSKKFHTLPREVKAVQQVSDRGVPLALAAPGCKLARAIEGFVLQYFDVAPVAASGHWWSRRQRSDGRATAARAAQYN
jgi:pilus assembly protein CpaE